MCDKSYWDYMEASLEERDEDELIDLPEEERDEILAHWENTREWAIQDAMERAEAEEREREAEWSDEDETFEEDVYGDDEEACDPFEGPEGDQRKHLEEIWEQRDPVVWDTLTIGRLGQALKGPYTGNTVNWEGVCTWIAEAMAHSAELWNFNYAFSRSLCVGLPCQQLTLHSWAACVILVRLCIRAIRDGEVWVSRESRLTDHICSLEKLHLTGQDLFNTAMTHSVLGFGLETQDRQTWLYQVLDRDLTADSTLEDLLLWLEQGLGGIGQTKWWDDMHLLKAALVQNIEWTEITEENCEELVPEDLPF